jgi:hypothetical protein
MTERPVTPKPGSLDALQKTFEAMTAQQRRTQFWKYYAELFVYFVLLNVLTFGLKFVDRPEGIEDTVWTSLGIFGPLPLVWRCWVVLMRMVRLRFVEERRPRVLQK